MVNGWKRTKAGLLRQAGSPSQFSGPARLILTFGRGQRKLAPTWRPTEGLGLHEVSRRSKESAEDEDQLRGGIHVRRFVFPAGMALVRCAVRSALDGA